MTGLAVIVAVAENGVIGRNNKLPWHLPNDLRYFRQVTMGKPVIMGRRTFESIGKVLPGRTNIVVSRDPEFQAEGARVVSGFDVALGLARDIALIDGAEESVVIGGAQLYAVAMARAARLYITRVHAVVDGDAVLPPIDWQAWREVSRQTYSADDSNPYDYSFVVYERIPR